MIYREGQKVEDSADSMEPGSVSGDNDEDAPVEEAEDSGAETALLPKSMVAGMEVKAGDEIRLKIVKLYDDEVEVEYAHADEKEDSEEGMEEIAADA